MITENVRNSFLEVAEIVEDMHCANKAKAAELAQERERLAQRERELLKSLEQRERELLKSLEQREREVSNREAALSQIMQTSADRKAQIETLKKSGEDLNKKRLAAEAKARDAEAEKRKLEDACALLLKEKRELEAKLECFTVKTEV